MSFRDDKVGLFWETLAKEKKSFATIPSQLPPIPDTGWLPPRDFPNLENARRIAIDIETKDLELKERGPGVRRGAHIVGLAIGADDDGRWYFPIRHEVMPEQNLDPGSVLAWASDALSGEQDKVGANILYDIDFLAEEGVKVDGAWFDVQVAEPLLDENKFSYSLDTLSREYLAEGKVTPTLQAWVMRAYGNKNYRQEIWRCPPGLVGPYAEGDVDLPLRILDKQAEKLREEELLDLFDIESGLLPMILAMRRHGVRIDLVKRQQVEDELSVAIKTAQQRLDAVAGFEVNINAGSHLVRAFDTAGVTYPRTAPTKGAPHGNPSFTKEWMEHHEAPICLQVMEIRRLTKLRQFVQGFLEHQTNGRIHTLFHPLKTDEHGAVSGRFASSDPNLQNIPARDPYWGPRLRSIFVPEEGHYWCKHDWSQIEYRFLAHFARGVAGRNVQKLYRDKPNTDFHIMVSELTGLDRKPAKNINFGLVYGMGISKLARTLGMSKEQAEEEVFKIYHERAPFVRDTYNHASQKASSRGYVKTILGRRARFERWQPVNWNDVDSAASASASLPYNAAHAQWGNAIRRAFTHKALNRVLQGSAADLMKKAMLDIWRSGVYDVLPIALLTVHDELDHSVPRTKPAKQALGTVKQIMESTLELRVPIIATEKRGASWGACE